MHQLLQEMPKSNKHQLELYLHTRNSQIFTFLAISHHITLLFRETYCICGARRLLYGFVHWGLGYFGDCVRSCAPLGWAVSFSANAYYNQASSVHQKGETAFQRLLNLSPLSRQTPQSRVFSNLLTLFRKTCHTALVTLCKRILAFLLMDNCISSASTSRSSVFEQGRRAART